MSSQSSASYGKRQEFSAIAKLLERGYDIYQTLVDDQGIDCIIRKTMNGKPQYIDVQIKARSKDCLPKNAGRFATMTINEPRKNYLFIFYSEQVNSYWIIPSIELVEFASRNVKGKNVGKYHLLFTGMMGDKVTVKDKYEQYRDENGFKIIDKMFNQIQ